MNGYDCNLIVLRSISISGSSENDTSISVSDIFIGVNNDSRGTACYCDEYTRTRAM